MGGAAYIAATGFEMPDLLSIDGRLTTLRLSFTRVGRHHSLIASPPVSPLHPLLSPPCLTELSSKLWLRGSKPSEHDGKAYTLRGRQQWHVQLEHSQLSSSTCWPTKQRKCFKSVYRMLSNIVGNGMCCVRSFFIFKSRLLCVLLIFMRIFKIGKYPSIYVFTLSLSFSLSHTLQHNILPLCHL